MLPGGRRPPRRDGRGLDGQGLQACFGYPVAHEDAARRAIEAALAIVGQLEALNERLRRTSGVALAPWAAIHSGPAIVGELETGEGLSIVGEAPNVATRLDGVVEPGWVVITEATRKLVQGFYACDPLGARAIRGMPQARGALPGRRPGRGRQPVRRRPDRPGSPR